MAVTIHSSPQAFTPSDNPVVWTFSSNQTSQPNFSYIVEVYVEGVLNGRHRVFPASSALAHIDISETVKRYAQPISQTQTTVFSDQKNYVSAYIVVRERYGATPAYQASATSGTVKAFKARLTNKKFDDFTYSQHYLTAVAEAKFLTYSPNVVNIASGSSYFLSVYADGGETFEVVFELFDQTGASITGADIAFSTTSNQLIVLNFKSDYLISETLGVVTQADFDNAAYMEMWVTSGGGDPITEKKRVYLTHETCKPNIHCVWLNRLGGLDQYTFSHNRIDSSNVDSMSYEKQFGGWVGSSYVFDSNNSGVIQYMKTVKNKAQLVSGWIQEDEQQYLCQSMYNSPLCFIESDEWERVNIDNTAYELQNDDYEEEFTEIVEISLPNIDQSSVL